VLGDATLRFEVMVLQKESTTLSIGSLDNYTLGHLPLSICFFIKLTKSTTQIFESGLCI